MFVFDKLKTCPMSYAFILEISPIYQAGPNFSIVKHLIQTKAVLFCLN